MREIAQAIGWIWVVFQGLAGIYGFVSEVVDGGLETGMVKGGILVLVSVILALPGLVLIWWGRRGHREHPEEHGNTGGDSSNG